jgi:hypothetical protein
VHMLRPLLVLVALMLVLPATAQARAPWTAPDVPVHWVPCPEGGVIGGIQVGGCYANGVIYVDPATPDPMFALWHERGHVSRASSSSSRPTPGTAARPRRRTQRSRSRPARQSRRASSRAYRRAALRSELERCDTRRELRDDAAERRLGAMVAHAPVSTSTPDVIVSPSVPGCSTWAASLPSSSMTTVILLIRAVTSSTNAPRRPKNDTVSPSQ